MVAAVIILGIYIITLYTPVPFNLYCASVNHAASNKDNRICGIKFNNHNTTVMARACHNSPFPASPKT